MTDVFNPTKEEAKELIAQGVVLPRAAELQPAVQDAKVELEIAALLERVAVAREKGETISVNDQMLLDWAKEKGMVAPVKELTPRELMERGYQEAEYKRQDATAEAMKELESLSKEALLARRKVDWSDFRTKRAAAAQTKALEAKFDAAWDKIRDQHLRHVRTAEFRGLAESHVKQLREAFGEPFQEVK